jgi:hypothetical protein
MTAKEKIDKALIDSNESIKSNKKAFAELPKHIGENEQISFIMEGSLSIIVLTNQRILTLRHQLFSGTDVKDIPIKNINSTEIDSGMLLTKVEVKSSGVNMDIDVVSKDAALKLKTKINEAVNKGASDSSSASPSNEDDPLAKLEKLGELKAKGVLTEEEFTQLKAKLIGGL